MDKQNEKPNFPQAMIEEEKNIPMDGYTKPIRNMTLMLMCRQKGSKGRGRLMSTEI
ncbi:hypothetical protein [Hahella sp. NBU794]|uniref:hypothetical protein n=1 Tax=Hahella sp. NBU794 TaxID=3422590 RepID=UPI003D6F796D